MLNKFGRNAILYKCKADKILFYARNEDYKEFPFYQSICPKCKNPICYHCHRFNVDSYGNGLCCIRRKIYCMFFQDGLRLIAPINPDYDYGSKFRKLIFFFLIPGLNLLFFIATIHIQFLYKLSIKNFDLTKNNGYIQNYEDRFKKKKNCKILKIVIVFDIGLSVLLTFSFLIINIYFIIFMIIISLPFKLIPMKYYMGIAYGTYTN